MIGQWRLLEALDLFKLAGLPRFIIITGQRGQGKKTFAQEIAKKFNYPIVNVGIKVDDIRYMIETAYNQTEPIIYLMADTDSMSLGAKNSLLKVIEEPPQKAYFIMTLEQLENTLPTIISRSYHISLDNYDLEAMNSMIQKLKPDAKLEEIQILNKLDNYWQVQKVVEYGVLDFYNYVEKVYNNIYKVQSANCFKLGEKLDLKNDGVGYDLELFFIMYSYCCMEDLLLKKADNELIKILCECLNVTYRCKRMLSITGINKQMLLDKWILDIRSVWLNANKDNKE